MRIITSATSRRLVAASLALVTAASLACSAAADAASPTSSTSTSSTSPQSTSPHSAAPSSTSRGAMRTHYAVSEPLCAQTSSTRPRCFALHKVAVPKGTPGAVAFSRADLPLGPDGGYTPSDISTAYGVNPDTPTTQTVAIVDAFDDPYAVYELNRFNAQYHLPAETSTSFRKVNQTGQASPLPRANAGWAGEIALDLQTVRGLCHRCRILLVEGTRDSTYDLAVAENTAVRLGAKIVSNSYGMPENNVNAATIAAYRHPGVAILAATGDDGWYDWDELNDGSTPSASQPEAPAAFPNAVAVGGTNLELDNNGTRHSETVWNEDGASDENGGGGGAGGGGCSFLFKAPAWQSATRGYANLGCFGRRSTADVAADADPVSGLDVYSHYNPGWVTTGGTSLATPIIAALWALAGGPHGAYYPGQSLYDNLAHRAGSLYDVTEGSNSFCGGASKSECSRASVSYFGVRNPNNAHFGLVDCGFAYDGTSGYRLKDTQCHATTGLDGPSGVGVPTGLAAFQPIRPTVSVALPSLLKLRSGAVFTGSAHEPLSSTRVTGYAWSWGDGSAGATTRSASHTFARAGSYPVALTVSDSLGQRTTKTVTITVGTPLRLVINGRSYVQRRTAHHWNAAGSSDPNTTGRLRTYTWWWGDRSPARSGASAWHTYARAGKHTITLKVTDNTGVVTYRRKTVTVTR